MRFKETVHWHDGLFLQQHHFQTMERAHAGQRRAERALSLQCTEGFIDLDIDREALGAKRIVLRSFSCLMPDGTELSAPGNATVAPLPLTPEDEEQDHLMIYLAVPVWSADEANVSTSAKEKDRLWSVEEREIWDENSGGNEIPVGMRRLNAKIVTSRGLSRDYQELPLLRLVRVAKNTEGARLAIDETYMPPFVLVTESSPLLSKLSEFLFELKSRRDRLVSDMASSGFNAEALSGLNLLRTLQLQAVNRFEASVAPMLRPGYLTPLALYRELRVLLGELAALKPGQKYEDAPPYVHEDSLPAFEEILRRIRALILAEGGAGYRRIDFTAFKEGILRAELSDEDFIGAEGWYLSVQAKRDKDSIVHDVQNGDNFRLITPETLHERVRGFKLTEVQYLPHYLPKATDATWFRIEVERSPRMWREIPQGKALLIDFSEAVFPQLAVSLYVTVAQKLG